MKARLLIVDQDARYREWLRQHLGVLCPEGTIAAVDVEEFERTRDAITRSACDLVVLSARFGERPEDPESAGLEWLRQLRGLEEFPAILALAEDGNELTAVRALQLGAADYLPKRLLTADRLRTAVRLALRRVELQTSSATMSRLPVAERSLRDPIAGYTIRRTIGESEKAIVYLATSDALSLDVALKVSKIERDEENERQALAREYEAICEIHDPAIVKIYDYGVLQGREYLAMEYFPRGDLKARVQRGMIEADVLRYIEQIARALEVVHAAGIVHRDLKPPNVMLRDNDEVVLIDFGLARVHGALQSTRKGVLRGSPYYMSPEQALGEKLDARTDLYSLGIICYEMLTGRKPYTGTSALDVLQQHVNAPMPRLPKPLEHLQSLLDGLLAKTPGERLASATQVVEAVSGLRALRERGGSAAVA
ncbi:MAG TPA: protein kinase [Steroidobacteraceae bacterium]|nr:protein kinase [Steroidobacteraceae bacterium]